MYVNFWDKKLLRITSLTAVCISQQYWVTDTATCIAFTSLSKEKYSRCHRNIRKGTVLPGKKTTGFLLRLNSANFMSSGGFLDVIHSEAENTFVLCTVVVQSLGLGDGVNL